MLASPQKTTLPQAPTKVLNFELSGNMNRYVCSIDNKVVLEADKILVKKNENLRLIIYNGMMTRHPMHLHGHHFRLMNVNGNYAPQKNIIEITPVETDKPGFNGNAAGD